MKARRSEESVCILVLGVHGSGTSAVAGVLHRLGVWMGDRLVGPNLYNPRGHYEDADFRELLYSYRSDRSLLTQIIAFLESRFVYQPLWGLKEPAILEVINDVGDYLDTRPYRIIATDRDHVASARSYVRKWPSADIEDVMRLHDSLRSQRESFLQRHRAPTLWIGYNNLTQQPSDEIRRITEFVFAGRPTPPPVVIQRATDFIDPDLNHHRELIGQPSEVGPSGSGRDPRTSPQRPAGDVDADLKRYFDAIPKDQLMEYLQMRFADPLVLPLIRSWLEAAIVERDDRGTTVHRSDRGADKGE